MDQFPWSRASSSNYVNYNAKRDIDDLMMMVIGDNSNNSDYSKINPVMTEEQIETLRKQIALYSIISKQLTELQKSATSLPDSTTRGNKRDIGNLHWDPSMMLGNNAEITPRQRWTPTQVQFQMLENIFKQGYEAPNKLQIKEITCQLVEHGQITELNVYNWFQNRRARTKKKAKVARDKEQSSSSNI